MRMYLCCLAAATAWAGGARAEPDMPPPAAFVASMEVSIELCSRREPERAKQYAALRTVVNALFAKRNYAAYVGTPAYRRERVVQEAELKATTPEELAAHCASLLALHQNPPQEAVYPR